MQPTQRFKKTLLAGALILGTCNAFNASADLFPVTAGAIPDVVAAPVAGFTQLSFGSSIIGNKNGESCVMQGISEVDMADMLFDPDGDNTDGNDGHVNGTTLGTLSGNACIDGEGGEVMIIEIEGATGSTVSVTVADVTGAGFTYTPTAQSCVVDFDGGATANTLDVCQPLTNNTVTGIGMSAAQSDGVVDEDSEIPDAATGYAAIVGKTRMILAGSITLTEELAQGADVSENVIVQITYE